MLHTLFKLSLLRSHLIFLLPSVRQCRMNFGQSLHILRSFLMTLNTVDTGLQTSEAISWRVLRLSVWMLSWMSCSESRQLGGRPLLGLSLELSLPSWNQWCHNWTWGYDRASCPYTARRLLTIWVGVLPSWVMNRMFTLCSSRWGIVHTLAVNQITTKIIQNDSICNCLTWSVSPLPALHALPDLTLVACQDRQTTHRPINDMSKHASFTADW